MQKMNLRKNMCNHLDNSVFGKTNQNKRKQRKIRFATNEKKRRRPIFSVIFKYNFVIYKHKL